MAVKIYNLLLASCTMLLVGMSMMDTREPINQFDCQSILLLLSAPVWLAGAVCLFLAKPWAWYASVLGAAVMLAMNAVTFASGLVLAPIATDPTDGIGYMIIIGIGGIALSLPLVISLFWTHQSLITVGHKMVAKTGNQDLQHQGEGYSPPASQPPEPTR